MKLSLVCEFFLVFNEQICNIYCTALFTLYFTPCPKRASQHGRVSALLAL
eukprot:m.84841 g.84841  ORF g.84841 m.84841 type:complete len:50 (+) comp12172_c0_seq1:374-523(+)